jgi:DNA mismatch repair protein MutS
LLKLPPSTEGATPFMAQYLEMKARSSGCDAVLPDGRFLRAVLRGCDHAGQALGITQTFRGQHNGQPIPMAGVPYHAAEGYLSRLIKAGYRVAVCEQTEDPAEAKKRGRSANCLAAIGLAAGGREAALAIADVSTGRFEVFGLGACGA